VLIVAFINHRSYALMADEGLTFRRVIDVVSRANGTELGSRVGALKAKRCS
jgi:hypothetical protein